MARPYGATQVAPRLTGTTQVARLTGATATRNGASLWLVSRSSFVSRKRTRLTREDFVVKLSEERAIARTLDDQWAATPLKGLGKAIASQA